jgi:hypothetical protein
MLSQNTRLSREFIIANIDKFSMYLLNANKCFDQSLIDMFKHYDQLNILDNPNLSEEFMFANLCNNTVSNPAMTLEMIQKINISEYPYAISHNPNIDMNYIDNNIQHLSTIGLSSNTHLSPEFIRKYCYQLNWYQMWKNRALTINMICEFIKEFDVYITPDNIQDIRIYHHWKRWTNGVYKLKRKLHMSISKNPNLTHAFIRENADLLYWYWLAQNPCMTLEFLEENIARFKGVLYV